MREWHLNFRNSSFLQIFSFCLGPRGDLGGVCVIYGHWNESLHARREDPFSPPPLLHLMHFSYLVNLLMVFIMH